MSAIKPFRYKCYQTSFTSIPQIMRHMQDLQVELAETDLVLLQYFNQTYFIITKNVYQKNKTNFFLNKKTMTTLDINFAQYYFDALKNYVEKKETTPAWQITFDFYKQNNSFPLIYLAQGVNAHVNNDLGLSLFDVVKHVNFKSDFDKVNNVIYASVPEVLRLTREKQYYQPFLNLLIRHWRYNAWRNYMKLQDETFTKIDIENKAKSIAYELTKIHSKRNFNHLSNVL